MTKIIITNKKGWLGHKKGLRVDTDTIQRARPLKKVKEKAVSKKAIGREKAIK